MTEFVSWDDDIPNIWKNKHVPNHQPAIIIIKDIQEIFRILWVQIRHYQIFPWDPEIPGTHPECCALCTRRMLMRPDTRVPKWGYQMTLSMTMIYYDLVWFCTENNHGDLGIRHDLRNLRAIYIYYIYVCVYV